MILSLSLFLFILTLLAVYAAIPAVAYFLRKATVPKKPKQPRTRFAALVPAHDEEPVVAETVKSLSGADYPEGMLDIVVVADNCTDGTAAVAAANGARVLVRKDPGKRGKGYALAHAMEILLREPYDAIVVVDADSVVNPGFFLALDARIQEGEGVIQAYDGIANPDASVLTYMFAVGNAIENRLFYDGKAAIGLPAMLRGNGMCFTRKILDKHPWNSFSVTEDTEHSLCLLEAGVPVRFAPEAIVLARQPETFAQAKTQRIRWASGTMKMSKARAFELLLSGIRKRRFFLADAGLTLIVLSKPLMLLLNLVAVAAALLWGKVSLGSGNYFLTWALVLLVFQCVYLCVGVRLEGFSGNRLKHLMAAPAVILWFFLITLLGLAGYRGTSWARTERST
ncbi:MAG: glycosyltransferase family 2 protein [Syntrophales bacterium]